jgi:hypothetical protein
VERVLKFVAGTLFGVALVVLTIVYGLYFRGASDIPSDWGPSSAVYPESARRALWRIEGGNGEPAIRSLTPPGFVWRIVWKASDDDRLFHRDGELGVLARVSYPSRSFHHTSMLRWHLMRAAMTIQASHWPRDRIFDTALEREHELRAMARRFYGREVEDLDDAQLHALLAVGGNAYWCSPQAARKRLAATSRWAVGSPSRDSSDAAVAAMLPAPTDLACR